MAPACADQTFLLTQSEARAGDTVLFSIGGAKKRVTYHIVVGGKEALRGSDSADGAIVGQFTMPDLGATSRTVTVEAIEERHGTTVARRTLQYLLPALPEPDVSTPPATAPAPAPVSLQQTAPSTPDSAPTVPAATTPLTPRTVEEHSTPAPTRGAGKPRTTRRNRGPRQHLVVKKTRAKHRTKHRTKRRAARTAPLFDGLRESSSGGSSIPPQTHGAGFLSLHAIASPTSVLATAKETLNAAVMVPALLGLVALGLAGTALMRTRLTARKTGARTRVR